MRNLQGQSCRQGYLPPQSHLLQNPIHDSQDYQQVCVYHPRSRAEGQGQTQVLPILKYFLL